MQLRTCLVMLALLVPLHSQAAPLYTATLLPAGFNVADLNNAGRIAGTILPDQGGALAAVYADGVLTALDNLGGSDSAATGINEDGAITGTFRTGGVSHAFVYEDGTVRDLGAGTFGHSINAQGEVVGTITTATGSAGFIYRNGALTELANLATGTHGTATDINDAGAIAGISTIDGGNLDTVHPYLFQQGALLDLGTLPGYPINRATTINNAGQVAGFSDGPGLSTHAFIYQGGVMHDLGDAGATYLEVHGINEDGTLIGSAGGAGRPFGFVSLGGALVALNALIDPILGWEILDATAINDVGQIVGWGCNTTTCGAVRLDLLGAVPEPGMALLLLPGLLLVSGMRRRQQFHSAHR